MSDWRDVMNARADADGVAQVAADAPHLPTLYIVNAILAVRLELRALGTTILYAKGDRNV